MLKTPTFRLVGKQGRRPNICHTIKAEKMLIHVFPAAKSSVQTFIKVMRKKHIFNSSKQYRCNLFLSF